MGTKGFVAFAVDGELKVTYNHYDSYPACLGMIVLVDVSRWVMRGEVAEWAALARKLTAVSDETPPTPEQIERLKFWGSLRARKSKTATWYELLRETQGNPEAILRAGHYEPVDNFPAKSGIAEWGYVIDFDAEKLEAYAGRQTKPHDLGRFAKMTPTVEGYWPVALVWESSFGELPRDELEVILAIGSIELAAERQRQ